MRQSAVRLNRAWLAVLGLLLLLAGLAVLVVATGLLAPLAAALGLGLHAPVAASTVLGAGAAGVFGLTWVVVLVALVGVILALLGLAWLIAQVPRSNAAATFRLHDTAATGMTRCAPSVLSDAVAAQVEALPGVQDADAVLRGSVQDPDLTLRVTVDDRTSIPELLGRLQDQVAGDVGDALDTRLRRLGVQVEVTTTKVRRDRITV